MIHQETIKELAKKALAMRSFSYAPYSEYRVGAALLGEDGRIYTGCNVENAAFSVTNCAERTALFHAVSQGCHSFQAIAIAGGNDQEPDTYCMPCGVCRQALMEFCSQDFPIISVRTPSDWKLYSLGELLVLGFGPENVHKQGGERD